MDQSAEHHDSGEHHEDHGGLKKYYVVFFCLCLLTLCSFMTVTEFWKSHFAKEPTWIFMMGVSCTKAMLVILCFMHLWWEANWKYVLTIPAALMSVFLLLMLTPDVGCRRMNYSEERIIHAAVPDQGGAHEDAHAAGAADHDDSHNPAEAGH